MKSKRVERDVSAATGEDSTADDPSNKRPNYSSGDKAAAADEHDETVIEGESTGLRLLGLLLQCAECVAMDNLEDATDLLPEISQLSSPFGSSPERVGAYFAHALQARVVSSSLRTYSPLDNKSLTLTQSQKIFNALQSYNSISPLVKFSHFTANQAIFQALSGEDCVHVIDLDIMQGLQWPGLFHILASRSKKDPIDENHGVRILVGAPGVDREKTGGFRGIVRVTIRVPSAGGQNRKFNRSEPTGSPVK